MDSTDQITGAAQNLRIFLLDDHEVVRRGMTDLLSAVPGFEVVGEASTAAQAITRILAVQPDVAVLDARLRDGSGVDVCREIRSRLPETHCLILTSYDDDDAELASVLAGASGYVLKEVGGSTIIDAIRAAALGHSLIGPEVITRVMERVRNGTPADRRLASLTDREREVLNLIADGMTNRQIAEHLFLAEKTIKNYVSSLFAKLDMHRRSQAAVYGAEIRRT